MLIVYNYGQIYYVDPAAPGELKNFGDVFLSSQALEGISLSMVSWSNAIYNCHSANFL